MSVVVVAQNRSVASVDKADTTLLRESMERDTLIKHFRVVRTGDANYSIFYSINLSRLNTHPAENSTELKDLDDFFSSLAADTMRKVQSITITGYSSPDGPHIFNERLAKSRMADFVAYAERNYNPSEEYNIQRNYVAEDWESCRKMVESLDTPDKQRVLEILAMNITQDEKEAHLKRMPEVWEYMTSNILPHLRRVDVAVRYCESSEFERRIVVAPPKPAPAPKPEPKPEVKSASECDCVVVDEGITGIIVETSYE